MGSDSQFMVIEPLSTSLNAFYEREECAESRWIIRGRKSDEISGEWT